MSSSGPKRLLTTVKSALVGGLATGVDLTAMTLLVHGLGVLPRVASPIALTLGVVLQFVGNKLFAFEDRRPRWGQQAAWFLAVEALGFAANVALFDVMVRVAPLPMLLVRVACQACVYFGLCLPLWSRIFAVDSETAARSS